MSKVILTYILVFIPSLVFCTGQIPDLLIVKKDTVPIFSNPLEEYFKKKGERELVGFKGCSSTACWRGYKAIWKLKNDSLFLMKVTSCHDECGVTKNADLIAMFGSDTVFANWYNGKVIIPKGELVHYIHMGYGSIYEKEKHLKFKNGVLKREEIISNDKIAEKIRFRKKVRKVSIAAQDTMFSLVRKNIDWQYLDSNSGFRCDNSYILTFDENGEIKSIRLEPWSDSKLKMMLMNLLKTKC